MLVIGTRQKIVQDTDAKDDALSDDDEAIKPQMEGPSNDALAKFTDFSKSAQSFVITIAHPLHSVVPYTSDEQATAATKNANLKLLFRLAKFYMVDEGERLSH